MVITINHWIIWISNGQNCILLWIPTFAFRILWNYLLNFPTLHTTIDDYADDLKRNRGGSMRNEMERNFNENYLFFIESMQFILKILRHLYISTNQSMNTENVHLHYSMARVHIWLHQSAKEIPTKPIVCAVFHVGYGMSFRPIYYGDKVAQMQCLIVYGVWLLQNYALIKLQMQLHSINLNHFHSLLLLDSCGIWLWQLRWKCEHAKSNTAGASNLCYLFFNCWTNTDHIS